MALSIMSAAKALSALRHGAEAVRHLTTPTGPRQGAQVFALPTSVGELHGDADAIARPTAAVNDPQPPTPVETLYDHPRLSAWLNFDFRQAGYAAGVAWPDHEGLEHELKTLRSRFENLLSYLEADLAARIAQAEQRVADLGHASPLASARAKATIARLRADVEEVGRQRLAGRSNDTGWLLEAIASFVAGYSRALKEATQANYFLR
jgi:hypothetical protein